MKNMKIAQLFGAAALALTLAACGGGSAAPAEKEEVASEGERLLSMTLCDITPPRLRPPQRNHPQYVSSSAARMAELYAPKSTPPPRRDGTSA